LPFGDQKHGGWHITCSEAKIGNPKKEHAGGVFDSLLMLETARIILAGFKKADEQTFRKNVKR
jgi:hypothetical protein